MPPKKRPPGARAPSERAAAERRLAAILARGAQGAALARVLAREGVRTRADLRKPAVFARLPRESQANVLYNPVRDLPGPEAAAAAAEVARRLQFGPDETARPRFEVIPVGSVRRQAPRAKDLDLLVVVPDAASSLACWSASARGRGGAGAGVLEGARLRPRRAGDRLEIVDTYAAGTRRRSLVLRAGPRRCYRADLFLATAAELPFALYHLTGSRAYNIRIRAYAKRRGWLLNQYGLFDATNGRRVRGTTAIRTEQDLARFLGVTYRAPPQRV